MRSGVEGDLWRKIMTSRTIEKMVLETGERQTVGRKAGLISVLPPSTRSDRIAARSGKRCDTVVRS